MLSLLVLPGKGWAADLDSVYNALDEVILHKAHYDRIRETKIFQLKNRLKNELRLKKGDYILLYQLNENLVEAYKAYRYDSVASYLNRNIAIAMAHNDRTRTDKAKLKLIYLFASSGMYLEAVNMIQSIDRAKLDHSLLVDYYTACAHTYGEQMVYTRDADTHLHYLNLLKEYNSLLLAALPPNSMPYLRMKEDDARYNNRLKEALYYNSLQMKLTAPGSPEYSIVCFFRSEDYKIIGDKKMQCYWLGLSAINDIKSAVKDQASLWTLAQIVAQNGDIERSYRYIRFSWDCTKGYNTPLRNLQTSGVLSMIDHSYLMMTDKQNSRLRLYLFFISALSLLLIMAIIYVYVQMKHLAEARNKLHDANSELTLLNDKLTETVDSLHKSNTQLTDSNNIKEVYIGRFLSMCSLYVDKLDEFRKAILKKAKNGQLSDFLSGSKIQSLKDEDLEDLLRNFDRAFLKLYPHFINEFNKLLKPEAQIKLPSDELLNTELRLFALIRLGIEDSSKIAELLHYSVNTIYNYRAKVKNASVVPRDEFEKRVKEIGR